MSEHTEKLAAEIERLAREMAEQIASDKLTEILKGATIRWPENNNLFYLQDMQGFVGVPSIEFEVEKFANGLLIVRGPEHGGTPYGNGAIGVHGQAKGRQKNERATVSDRKQGSPRW